MAVHNRAGLRRALRGLVLSGNKVAVAFRADDLDPQIARYAFDEGQAAFANARVAQGSFAVCCGWVIVSTRFLPRWLGWLAIASGVGLVLSRISWTGYFWLPFYLMFWIWVSRWPWCSCAEATLASPNPVDPCAAWSCLSGVLFRGLMILGRVDGRHSRGMALPEPGTSP